MFESGTDGQSLFLCFVFAFLGTLGMEELEAHLLLFFKYLTILDVFLYIFLPAYIFKKFKQEDSYRIGPNRLRLFFHS